MKTIKKTLMIIIFIALYYPIVVLTLFYSFILRAAIALGRLPFYNNPDPKDLGFYNHHDLVSESLNYLLYSILIVFTYGVVCLIAKKNILKINNSHFYVYIGLITWQIFLIFTDFFEWFID